MQVCRLDMVRWTQRWLSGGGRHVMRRCRLTTVLQPLLLQKTVEAWQMMTRMMKTRRRTKKKRKRMHLGQVLRPALRRGRSLSWQLVSQSE